MQGNARSGKTVGAENLCLRNWIYGPSRNVIWYMQTRADVDDYVEERVEWMLAEHEEVSKKINWKNRRQSRNRKRIGTSLARWLAATPSTTRGKAAPLIVADEIDGYPKKIRKAILTLLRNRQREFGAGALLYVASHPDAGPDDGVANIISMGTAHHWYFNTSCCGKPASYNQGARWRMQWNLPALLAKYEGVEYSDRARQAAKECALVCPHCHAEHDEKSRLENSNRGTWLQGHQTLNHNGAVVGEPIATKIMGFAIHAFMSPFVDLNELAEEWAIAKLQADDTLDYTAFKEVVVKSLGEVFEGTEEAEKQEDWSVVKKRLKSAYIQKTVPDGVQFLTAFVDVQGDRFEVVVIGWNKSRESWLIDRFALKQWPGFNNIDPANRLTDWRIIELAVLNQSYPLASDPKMHLPIARVAVDTGGGGDVDMNVTLNARLWAREISTRDVDPVPEWRVMLTKGDAHKKGELYGKPRRGLVDDHGTPLEGAPWERTLNVHEIKRIIIKRMKIEIPGPGRMHLPSNVEDRYVRELVSEKLLNGEWIKSGRNETWDGWVNCDAARASLAPERKEIDWNKPPSWASPFPIKAAKKAGGKSPIDNRTAKTVNPFDRLVARNTKPEQNDVG